jgi:repressor LexA
MPRKPSYLTERQKAILEFLESYQSERGLAPTLREICEHFGFSSYGTAYKHLRLLGEKGFLRRDWNQKRGLELLKSSPIKASAGLAAAEGSPATAEALPFLGRIAAGRPIEAIAQGETLDVPTHLLGGRGSRAPRAARSEHYVLQVVGDSMIGEGIFDGDWVVVERRDRAETGEVVVALVGEEATVKGFYPEGEVVRLQPSNPSMQPIRVPATDVRVQGVVVGLMRRF